MMPPEQENHNIIINKSGAENISIQIDLPSSTRPKPHDHKENPNMNHTDRARLSVLRESLRPITLKFEDVSYSIKLPNSSKGTCFSSSSSEPKQQTRTILSGVSGTVRPGELLAMLGPSGSGKTTLLSAISGRLAGKFSGKITYNGKPFSSSVRCKMGFVTQDEVLYPHLTVLETLTYAALLKLPKTLTRKEKIEQAEMVVAQLGLARCRNSVVGGPLLRGVSGGERKRVSIGLEMLINPSLLLVDEPTSGLDSTTAQRIVGTLRWAARGGRTVVATVHQPSSRLFGMFDKVVVLCEGCPIYSGGVRNVMDYFASIGYAPKLEGSVVNPADFLLDLANGMTPDPRHDDSNDLYGAQDHHDDHHTSIKQFLIHSYRKNLHPLLKQEIHNQGSQDQAQFRNISPSSKGLSSEDLWTNTWWLQFKVLLSRGLKERKHESYSGLRIFQVMSVSFISGLLWWHSDANHIQDQVGLLFFFSIFWGFFPLFNAIFVFPQERPLLAKERSSGMYRLSSYYIARIIGDLPMELILPTIFTVITYWMGGLKPSFVTFAQTLSIVLLNVLVAQSLGLALGAVLMEAKQATTLSSVLMLVFLLASGYYIQHMPPFIDWLKYVSFSHYCYKLLVGVQYKENEVYDCGSGVGYCKAVDFAGIKVLGIGNMALDVAALGVMLVGYRVLAYVALRNHS